MPGGSSQTTVQKADPWEPSKPFIEQGLNDARNLYNSGGFKADPYQGPTYYGSTFHQFEGRRGIQQNTNDQVNTLQGAQDALTRAQTSAGNNQTAQPFNKAINNTMGATVPYMLEEQSRQAAQLQRDPRLQLASQNVAQRGIDGFADNMYRAVGQDAARPDFGGYINPATDVSNDPRFNQGLRDGQNTSTDNYFDFRTQKAGQVDGGANSAVQQSMRDTTGGIVGDETSQAANFGVTDAMQRGVGAAQQQSPTARFNRGIGDAQNRSMDPRFTRGVNTAQNSGNDARFDRTVNDMTGPAYDDRLANALRRNVSEAVMPGVNQTFAGSGMTGSSLHQAQLAKQMATGMAGVEADLINRSQDRQFAAANAAQDANETRIQRVMQAGDMAQGYADAGADRSLRAGIASQAQRDDARERSLRAGQAYQGAAQGAQELGLQGASLYQNAAGQDRSRELAAGQTQNDMANDATRLGLDAAGMRQDALETGRARSMAAGQAAQNNVNTERQRLLSAAGLNSQADVANNAQRLQAGQLSQSAQNANLDRQLASATNLSQDNLARAQLGIGAGQALDSSRSNIRNQQLAAGQAAQNNILNNRQDVMQAAGLQPTISNATYDPYRMQEQVGQLWQDHEQMKINDTVAKHYENQNADLNAVNNYLALTSGLGGQFATQQSSGGARPGALGILGTGIQGLGTMGLLGLLSDVRAKENIRKVGELDNGLNVYVYNYKGDPTFHMGVMAQEVEQVAPQAVYTGGDGMKRVLYGELANV